MTKVFVKIVIKFIFLIFSNFRFGMKLIDLISSYKKALCITYIYIRNKVRYQSFNLKFTSCLRLCIIEIKNSKEKLYKM